MQSYNHFTLVEREYLCENYKSGRSLRDIAKQMHRSPSSICRELNRNRNKDGSYHPWRATILYICRRKVSKKPFRMEQDSELADWVAERLHQYWSPEAISARWRMEHPGMKLSASTIYSALKAGKIEGCSAVKHLRRHNRRKYTQGPKSNAVHPERMIREWPEEIRERLEVGHLEGDTVYGGIGKGYLITLVDRKSRKLYMSIVRTRNSKETNEGIIRALKGTEVRSISLDNGSEFAEYREMEQALNIQIYFADPHAPWQRGTNENMNDIVRFYYPKGTDFRKVSEEEVAAVAESINNRPRKCLGWLSPNEFLAKCCT